MFLRSPRSIQSTLIPDPPEHSSTVAFGRELDITIQNHLKEAMYKIEDDPSIASVIRLVSEDRFAQAKAKVGRTTVRCRDLIK